MRDYVPLCRNTQGIIVAPSRPWRLVEEFALRQSLPKRLLGFASDLRRERDPLEVLDIAEVGKARELKRRADVLLQD